MATPTPTDKAPAAKGPQAPKPSDPEKKKKVPSRGTRKRVLGEGEGDYCIYEIADGSTGAPKGALIPIPGVPRFEKTVDALKWVRTESGDTLTGKQVGILAFKEILDIRVETKPVVRISAKSKVVVNDPEAAKS